MDKRSRWLRQPSWINEAVFYQIVPSSFFDANGDGVGDIQGITKKLSYIESLGCNAILLNPIFESPFMNGGYDVIDHKIIAERFGCDEDFDELIVESHKRGIKVVLDMPLNFVSEKNKMFIESGRSQENEYSNMFIWTKDIWRTQSQQRFEYGRHERNGACMVNTFSFQPCVNYGFSEIVEHDWQMHYKESACLSAREWLIDILEFWLKKGCDGYRIESANVFIKNDESKKANIEFWQDIISKIKNQHPECAFICNWGNPDQALRAGFDIDVYKDYWENGYNSLLRSKSDGVNNGFFTKEGKGDITKFTYDYLRKFLPTMDLGYIGFMTGNHNTIRIRDWYDERQLKLVYGMLFTLPGIPFIYYGDEIGMKYKNLRSIEGGYYRTGSRTPMQWTNQDNKGFTEMESSNMLVQADYSVDAPSVEGQINLENSLLNFVKEILKLRRENKDFSSTLFEIEYCESNSFPFIYKRGAFTVVVNPTVFLHTCKYIPQGREVLAIGGASKENKLLYVQPQSIVIYKED